LYNCSLEGMCPSKSIVKDKQQTSAFKKSIVVTSVDSINLKTDPLSAKPAKMAVSLLRAALNGESYSGNALKGATEADWRAMAEIVGQSSVSAIITEALPPDEIKNIPFDVLKELYEFRYIAEDQYRKQELNLKEISTFLNRKGIDTIQLKGLGLSMLYPHPELRVGCDVDIFTRKKGSETLSRSNSGDAVDQMMLDAGLKVEHYGNPNAKHSEFEYKGTIFENHKFFVNKEKLKHSKLVDELLHKLLNPQETTLSGGTKILTPSKEFNTLFLAHHSLQHYIFGGLDLHNLADWSMHIRKYGLNLPKEVKGTKFEEFINALTNVSNRVLGTNIPVPENKEYENDILEKILHPERHSPTKDMNKFEILLFKVRRNLEISKKSKAFGGENPTKILIKTVLEKIHDIPALFRPF